MPEAKAVSATLSPILDLANTLDLDLELETDAIGSLAEFRAWISDPAATKAQHARSMELRSLVRRAMGRHHAGVDDNDLLVEIESLMSDVAIRLELAGAPRITSPGPAADRFAVAVAWGIALALRDGTWARMRVCSSDDCGEAFYDSSRSGTRRWCSMEVCGNRRKVKAFRDRQAT